MTRNSRNGAMLSTSDVANLLNVHINTVRRWSNKRLLRSYRIGPRGDRRFEQRDVANFLVEQLEKEKVRR